MRWEAVHAAAADGQLNVDRLCRAAGMSRANYYKQRVVRQRQAVDEQLVVALVQRERMRQPMLGGRKLRHMLMPELRLAGVSIGRDLLFNVLKRHDLLIPRRRRSARTTDSRHGFRSYPNLARELVPTGPHQLWVSDITYLRTQSRFVYLALVMDAWSRAIVGYDCSDSLEVEGALRSLAMALRQRPECGRPMHHSDRGIQYCCGAYIGRLERAGLAISMTEQNHCYENSQAERLNGTLKREYGLHASFRSRQEAAGAVAEAVVLYNHHRPHEALGYRTPMQVHVGALSVVA